MHINRLGYYKEMPHGEESDPSIKDFIGKNIENKKEVCDYLKKGIVLAACGQVVKDVILPEKGIAGAPDDMTDGKWLWPGDLAYYVENYDLQLPKEFIEYMKEKDWKVPDNLDIDFDKLEVR